MTKDAMTGESPRAGALCTGAWLDRRRLAVYPAIFIALYLAGAAVWAATADGWLDRRGMPLGSDFLGFWSASKVAQQHGGGAVYDAGLLVRAQTAAMGREVPFFTWLYPPTATLLVWPLALLSYGWALLLWNGAQLAAALAVLRRIAGHPLAWRLGLAFPATFVCLAHGQNALLSTALMGGGLLLLPTRPALAGALLAGLLYKPHLGLLIPLALLAARQWRALAGGVLAGLAYLGATLAVFGTGAWQAFLAHGGFAQAVLEQGLVDWGKMASVYAGLRLLGLGSAAAWVGQGMATTAAAWAVVVLWRCPGPHALRAAALAAASLLATPFLLDYDLMILAPALAWLAVEGMRTGFRPWEITALAAVWLSPMLTRQAGMWLHLPLGPLAVGLVLVLVLRRGHQG